MRACASVRGRVEDEVASMPSRPNVRPLSVNFSTYASNSFCATNCRSAKFNPPPKKNSSEAHIEQTAWGQGSRVPEG